MRTNASSTAAWVAACRGLGSALPDGLRLCDDPYGLEFAGPVARGIATVWRRLPRVSDGIVRYSGGLGQLIVWMQIRTRVLDDVLLEFVATGGRQVLLLGAGFDCRASRFASALQRVVVFEVDHPATQEKKRRVLSATNGTSARVEYLSWDFENRPLADLPAALAERGHQAGLPTLTIWEGVTMYLSEAAIDASVAAVRELSARGSRLALTYFERDRIDHPSTWEVVAARIVRGIGEPFRFGWDPATLPAWLATRGFTLASDQRGVDLARDLLPSEYAGVVREQTGRIAVAERT